MSNSVATNEIRDGGSRAPIDANDMRGCPGTSSGPGRVVQDQDILGQQSAGAAGGSSLRGSVQVGTMPRTIVQ